jgi:hypothetical protein
MSAMVGNLVSAIPGVGTVASAVETVVTFGGIFHTSSAGPNADAANAIAPEVAKGNLAAVAAAVARANITVVASAAPWKALLQSTPAPLIAAANARFPGNQWATFGAVDPSQVLGVVQKLAVYANPTTGATVGVPTGPGGGPAQPSTAGVAGSFFPAGASFGSILLVVGVGIAFYFLAKHSK